MSGGAIQMRAGQRRCFKLVDDHRLLAFVARRQYGKTTTFANIALKKMMKRSGHTVIFGSAKLNLSREIVRKEAAVFQAAVTAAMRSLAAGQFQVADSDTGTVPDRLTADDFAGLFEAQRLEFRLFHDRTVYSRTKVVALRPDTVGETGDVMADEVGRINNWRECWEAIEPIVSSDPEFRLLLSTTPPPDDAHYSFEQLAPPPGTVFAPNPEGNVYEVDEMTVLRVDAWDAYADGVPVYSLKDGEPLDPDSHRARYRDKDAWDRNYGCAFITGGSAAVALVPLLAAQNEGAKRGCKYYQDMLPPGWVQACGFRPGVPAVIGVDPATTEGQKSNPTGFCASQMDGALHEARALMRYKIQSPKEARAVIVSAVDDLLAAGIPVKCAVLDATSERYWCAETRQEIEPRVPVLLIVSSEREEYEGENVLLKTILGNEAVASLEDHKAALPPDKCVKDDFRLVRRQKGGFSNEVDTAGNHGDLFDAFKLALRGHTTDYLETAAEAVQVGAPSISLLPGYRGGRMPMRPDEPDRQERGELFA